MLVGTVATTNLQQARQPCLSSGRMCMRASHQPVAGCTLQSPGEAAEPRGPVSHAVVDGQGGLLEEPDALKPAAAELKDGMAFMLPAARTRANATYYGFIVLSLGIIVMVRGSYSSIRHRELQPATVACPILQQNHTWLCTRAMLRLPVHHA